MYIDGEEIKLDPEKDSIDIEEDDWAIDCAESPDAAHADESDVPDRDGRGGAEGWRGHGSQFHRAAGPYLLGSLSSARGGH